MANSTKKHENVRTLFRSNDFNYDWESDISKESGYELINCRKIENTTTPNWPKWSIIIDYKRYK